MGMILDAVVGKCVEKILASLEAAATQVLGVKDDLEELHDRLQMIRRVLKDAERRRFQNEAVNYWLSQLSDVIFDADYILDHCSSKRRRQLEDQPSSSLASTVRSYLPQLPSITCSLSFHQEIGQRIKNLNDRLRKVDEGYNMLLLTLVPSMSGGVDPRQTSPLEEEGIVGSDIKEATNQLVELILGKQKQKCRVFAIVGMAGIGKTTLAQQLYNDPRIMASFQEYERIWVCITENFSEIKLLKQIIRCAGGDHRNAKSKSELLQMLDTMIKGKPLFLVLDDVWTGDVWRDLLQTPLQRGTASRTIIVTTRNVEVANSMRAEYVRQVEKLPVETGWEMLCKRVFMNGEGNEMQRLKDIGIQIVEKCQGLPLAIKTMADDLSAKDRTRNEWENIVRSNTWSMSPLPEKLRKVLYLSYEDLPSHLKQCFLYLSLFPEGYEYKMSELGPLWIAEGFVKAHENSLEDTAKLYYTELIRRSLLHPDSEFLLQQDTEYFDLLNQQNFDLPDCKMHDCLRSLAYFLSGNECFCGNVGSISGNVTPQLRRLSVARDSAVLTADSTIRYDRLRTLLLLYRTPKIENNLISHLQYLHVLRLNVEGINQIPDSIGGLISLRYLNLDYTDIFKLPESLGRLINLQFLSLSNCKSLHTLPQGITELYSLRHLSMDGTLVRHVPKGIGKLQQLNHFSGLVLKDDDSVAVAGETQQGCYLEDFHDLSQLRFLRIERLERASTGMPALQNKPHLKELYLRCSPQIEEGGQQPYTEEEKGKVIKNEEIFNELIPPKCIESLTLDGFFGRVCPSWMLGTFLPHLSDITLQNFKSCQQVPPLGELPQLKSITIKGASAVVIIGPEFIGAGVNEGTTAFPKLERLSFENMANWKEWSLGGETEERAASHEGRIDNWSLMLFPRLEECGFSNVPIYRCFQYQVSPH